MKQTNRFVFDMLDQDAPDAGKDKIFRAGMPESASVVADLSAGGSCSAGAANSAGSVCGAVAVKVPFVHQVLKNMFLFPATDETPVVKDVVFRAYGDEIMRVTCFVCV